MKKIVRFIMLLVIIILLITSLTGCGNNKPIEQTNTNNDIEVNQTSNKKYTAEEIANKLKEKNSNIGKIVVYTEDTDLNKMLGRPNQYTSKVKFEDLRLEQMDESFEEYEPTGGTIEVFSNEKDMQSRKEYLEYLTSSSSFFAQYMYTKDVYILRINYQLTPTQAQEYEKIFNEIFN